MDPQQRLLLEVAWEALEDAGQRADRAGRQRAPASSSASATTTTAARCSRSRDAAIDAYFGTGNAHSVAAGRLSYVLGLHGPEPGDRHRLLVVAGGACTSPARACAPASATWRWPAAST